MAEEKPGLGEMISGAVDRAKGAVGGGDEHEADHAEGRVKVVREMLRSFGEGEHDRFFEVLHEEVEWVGPKGKRFPGAGTHSGRDAVREKFAGDVEQGLPSFGFRPDHYLDAEREEWVVTLGAFIGEGASGKFGAPGAVVWEFDGDKITRVRIYADSEAFPKPVEQDAEAGGRDEDDSSERAESSGNGQPEAGGRSEDEDDGDDDGHERSDDSEPRSAGATAASGQDSAKED